LNTRELTKKVKIEFTQNGLPGIIRKIISRAQRGLFYSTCSIFYELKLDNPLKRFTPVLNIETDFMVNEKNRLIDWLDKNKASFPWIYSNKEIESALSNKHPYVAVIHEKEIIGFVKIGIGPTYLRDFDKTFVLEPGTAFVYDTFILPAYRSRGLASYTVNEVALYLQKKGFNRILCHIESWNISSIKAFTKVGFTAKETIRFIKVTFISFYLINGRVPLTKIEKAL